jgi:hypothetical protein
MLLKSPTHRQPLPLLAPLSPEAEHRLDAFQRIRELAETVARKHVTAWAKTAGTTPDTQFSEDMTAALQSCLLECQGMWTRRSFKAVAEDFTAAAQHAAAIVEHIDQLLPVLERLPLMWPNGARLYDVTRRVRWPVRTARELNKLAVVARRNSERVKNAAGHAGRPVESLAFTKLARGVVQIAARANIKPKPRLRLMKSVLKTVRKLPEETIGTAFLPNINDEALDKHLSRIAAKFAKKRALKNRT